ncbi:3-phosphoglycerate dehydrogenase [Atopobium fossor]|uniref:3-phosphoglycerate dehydrogenase n=1 Tax=Atopobium fossor TaxID=39487 RepID=UPI000405DC86|nr:3-phosphoglycerate dehydrogenase [Atopobium fossor]
MYSYLCLNTIEPTALEALGTNFVPTDELSHANVVLVRSADMGLTVLPPSLLCIARAGVGTNNIPINRASEQGVVVFNAPGANANAVAELVIAGLLMSKRNLFSAATWVTQIVSESNALAENKSLEQVIESAKSTFIGHEITGQVLGVVGLGAIGVLVANKAVALGMRVLGYTHSDIPSTLSSRVEVITNLDELLANVDVLSLHVPATPANHHLLSKKRMACLKPGCTIVNFARAELVDEGVLAQVLKTGQVGAYVSDFPNATSIQMPNALLLPHLGASTYEATAACAHIAVQRVKNYLLNGCIEQSVNFGTVDLGPRNGASRMGIFYANQGEDQKIIQCLCNADVQIGRTAASFNQTGYVLIEAQGNLRAQLGVIMRMSGVIRARIIDE